MRILRIRIPNTGKKSSPYLSVWKTCFWTRHQDKHVDFRKIGELCHIGLPHQESVAAFTRPPDGLTQPVQNEGEVAGAQRPHQQTHPLRVPRLLHRKATAAQQSRDRRTDRHKASATVGGGHFVGVDIPLLLDKRKEEIEPPQVAVVLAGVGADKNDSTGAQFFPGADRKSASKFYQLGPNLISVFSTFVTDTTSGATAGAIAAVTAAAAIIRNSNEKAAFALPKLEATQAMVKLDIVEN